MIREGIAKDAIRLIQDMRKKRQCNFSDRIEVVLQTDVSLIKDAIQENHAFICSETLAVQLSMESTDKSIELEDVELADTTVQLGLCPIT